MPALTQVNGSRSQPFWPTNAESGDDPHRETTKAYAQVLEPTGTILYFSLVEELEGKGGLSYSFQIV